MLGLILDSLDHGGSMKKNRCKCGGIMTSVNSEVGSDGQLQHREGFGCRSGVGPSVRPEAKIVPGSVVERILSRPQARRGV